VSTLTLNAGTLSTSGTNYPIALTQDVLFKGGTLTMNASSMTVGGNWSYTSGTFTAGTSTITLTAG